MSSGDERASTLTEREASIAAREAALAAREAALADQEKDLSADFRRLACVQVGLRRAGAAPDTVLGSRWPFFALSVRNTVLCWIAAHWVGLSAL